MATRSTIAYQNPVTGNVAQVYCHLDGYLSGNGKTLAKHYQDDASVQRLVSGGDLSSIEDTTQASVYYHRDRGERFSQCQPRTFADWDMFKYHANLEDFNYIYSHGQWYLIDISTKARILLADLV